MYGGGGLAPRVLTERFIVTPAFDDFLGLKGKQEGGAEMSPLVQDSLRRLRTITKRLTNGNHREIL